MPRHLNDHQKAVRGRPSVSRAEARHLCIRAGQPYVHAGNERYLPLSVAITRAGIDHALGLVDDRRSVLLWPDYVPAGQIILHFLITANVEETTRRGVIIQGPGDALVEHLRTFDATDASPMFQTTVSLARHLHSETQRLATDAYAPGEPRAAQEIRHLLTLLSNAAAALYFVHDGNPPAPDTVRQTVGSIIHDPFHLIERINGLPLEPA